MPRPPESSIPDRFVVVSPTVSNNCVGRAATLRNIAQRIGPAELLAFDDGAVWPGAAHLDSAIVRYRDEDELHRLLDARDAPSTAVWLVKPWRQSATWGTRWHRLGRAGLLLFDEDDHDIAVNREWIAARPGLRPLSLHARHALAPRRVARRLASATGSADLVTTSSHALASEVGLPPHKLAVIPHAREVPTWTPPTKSPRLRIGFLGTPRGHKGADVLEQLLRWVPDSELHVFSQVAHLLGLPEDLRDRTVLHDGEPSDAVAVAMRDIDLIALPQAAESTAARYQLPAKLLDAMAYGRPTLATLTPVTEEYATAGVELLSEWTEATVSRAIAALGTEQQRREIGSQMSRAAGSRIGETAVARVLSDAIRGMPTA